MAKRKHLVVESHCKEEILNILIWNWSVINSTRSLIVIGIGCATSDAGLREKYKANHVIHVVSMVRGIYFDNVCKLFFAISNFDHFCAQSD